MIIGQLSSQMETTLIAAAVSLLVALLTSAVALVAGERKLRRDYRLEFAAETVAKTLLSDAEWRLRTFAVIKHHLAGFEENELRKILVRAGAIRFDSQTGHELWGLLERNRDRLGAATLDVEPSVRAPAASPPIRQG